VIVAHLEKRMVFNLLNPFKRKKHAAAEPLYAAAVAQARQPGFYLVLGLPDTPEGRFEAIAAHVYLVLRRLKGERAPGVAELSQDVFDILFHDMDESLREMGIGDLGISHRIKAMAKAFYGRVEAYDRGLAARDDRDQALRDALARDFYRTAEPGPDVLGGMAAYLRAADAHLAAQPLDNLLAGRVSFPPAPEAV